MSLRTNSRGEGGGGLRSGEPGLPLRMATTRSRRSLVPWTWPCGTAAGDAVADVAAPGPLQGMFAADEAVGREGQCRCCMATGRPVEDVAFCGRT